MEGARSAGQTVFGAPHKICVKYVCDATWTTNTKNRTFPEGEATGQDVADGASEHAAKKPQQSLPGILGWLVRPGSVAIEKTMLLSFSIAARSSAVADHYATKYLAKPQQWLASALGALITGFRRKEEEQKEAGDQGSERETSVQKMALRN